MYNKSLGITREMFIDFCSKYYSSPLDINSFEWDESDGVDANCLQKFCEKYDISHYCYDICLYQCVIKHISKNRNYKSLCYYSINGHMYLIKDKSI